MSNYGGATSLFAQGIQFLVARAAPDGIEIRKGGTSFAAPYVTGWAYKLMTKILETVPFEIPELRAGALKTLLYEEFRVQQLAHMKRSLQGSKAPDGEEENNEQKKNPGAKSKGEEGEQGVGVKAKEANSR